MLPAPAQRALSTLAAAVVTPALGDALRARWRAGGRGGVGPQADGLSEDLCASADQLAAALPLLTHMETAVASLCELFGGAEPALAEVLFSWCAASVWRRDVQMARLLASAAVQPAFRDRAAAVARDRVVEGPLLDALACAPLLGKGGRARASREHRGARAARDPDLGSRRQRPRGARARALALGLARDLRRDDPRPPRTARCAAASSRRAASR